MSVWLCYGHRRTGTRTADPGASSDLFWKEYALRLIENMTYEPPHDKINKMTVRPTKIQMPGYLSLRWAHGHFVGFVKRRLISFCQDIDLNNLLSVEFKYEFIIEQECN